MLLPYDPKNNEAIVARIEAAKGPVGKGHHNAHRTANIMTWLGKKESGGNDTTKQPPSKGQMYTQAMLKATQKGGK